MPLYIEKSEIWSGVTANWQLTQWQTLKDRATQLLISRSGALITQLQPKNPDLYLQKSLIILKLGSEIAIIGRHHQRHCYTLKISFLRVAVFVMLHTTLLCHDYFDHYHHFLVILSILWKHHLSFLVAVVVHREPTLHGRRLRRKKVSISPIFVVWIHFHPSLSLVSTLVF